jgi:putative endonuclease
MRALLRLLSFSRRPPAAPPPDATAPQIGAWGEEWAEWHYYHERGSAVLARNWRGGGGELDLVVREGEHLVFVEVKTRDPKDPEPLAAVREGKRRRHFRAAADAYTRQLPRPRPAVRFDVVLVTPDPEGDAPQINVLTDVLSPIED